MSDRRSLLRSLFGLPFIGTGLTIISRPATAVPPVQVAALPTLDDPYQRARNAWEVFSAAMRDVTADADGWCILGAADRWTPLSGPHPGTGSFLRVAAVHIVDERRPGAERPFFVERHREVEL